MDKIIELLLFGSHNMRGNMTKVCEYVSGCKRKEITCSAFPLWIGHEVVASGKLQFRHWKKLFKSKAG